MYNGDTQLNGCEFYFGNDKYCMRISSQSVMYDETVHLGNQQAKDVELHRHRQGRRIIALYSFWNIAKRSFERDGSWFMYSR